MVGKKVYFKVGLTRLSPTEVEFTRAQLHELNKQIQQLQQRKHLLQSRLAQGVLVQCGTVIEIDKGDADAPHIFPVKAITADGKIHYLAKEQIVKHTPLE